MAKSFMVFTTNLRNPFPCKLKLSFLFHLKKKQSKKNPKFQFLNRNLGFEILIFTFQFETWNYENSIFIWC